MNFFSNIFDAITNKSAFIDRFRNLRVANTKRITGSNFGSSIDTTYMYTVNNTNGGTATASSGVATLATNTTANGATELLSKPKVRYLSGRNNINRFVFRFGDTGTANNVRQVGMYVDANNCYIIRLSGTTFSCVLKKNGVETVVNNGSFNGNGTGSNQSYTVTNTFQSLEILMSTSRIEFIINDIAIHTFNATTTSLVSSVVGNIWMSNVNSGGSTTNCLLETIALSASYVGDAVNNPAFYNINAVAETRTLKSGGGTLQSISVTRAGGNGAMLTLYDSLTGSGTIIGIWDLNALASVGSHPMGIEGVNFYNGLTYVTSGTMTSASVTVFWE